MYICLYSTHTILSNPNPILNSTIYIIYIYIYRDKLKDYEKAEQIVADRMKWRNRDQATPGTLSTLARLANNNNNN